MNAQQQRLRQRRRSFPRSRTTPLEGGGAGSFGHGGTARMVRGATACTNAGTVGAGTNDGHPLGFGTGPGDDNSNHPRQQQRQDQSQEQQQQQQQQARGEQHLQQPEEVQAHSDNKNGDVGEPTAEWEAMVLERVSKMGLGDDDNNNHTDGNGGSSGVPSPAATSTSTSISTLTSASTSTSAASVEDPVQVTITAPIARPPARRFQVRAAGTTSAATNQSITGIDGTSRHQSTGAGRNKTNKRGATDMATTPVTNNQSTRPLDQTPPPTVGSHPLLLLGNTDSTSTSNAGLLPRLSPPLGLQSPTTNTNVNDNANANCKYIHATASSASSSPTSTTATPTVTAQMLSCSIPTTTTTTTTTTTLQQLSADGTSLTIIDGGPNGGGPRKRRMLKKRHCRSNASLISGAAFGYGGTNGGGGRGDTNDGSVVKEVGCLGGILPDLAGIFDGACGGGTEDVVEGGTCTASTSNAYANGIGGRNSLHPLAAGGCGSSSSSSFPDPFGLVTRARRSRSRSPRPSSTTLGSGGTRSQGSGSSRFAPPNCSPVPHPLARLKRPSAPTPPGASTMGQSSSVFDRRLDRLASGVQMPSSKGTSTTAGDSSSGSGMPAPPNLVPKFRASPLPFSANLHVTPQPRRVTASRHHTHHGKPIAASGGGRNGTAGRRVRGGAKPGSNMGATLSAATGFGGSAVFAAPSFSRGSTPVPPPGNGGTIPAPPPTPVGTML